MEQSAVKEYTRENAKMYYFVRRKTLVVQVHKYFIYLNYKNLFVIQINTSLDKSKVWLEPNTSYITTHAHSPSLYCVHLV